MEFHIDDNPEFTKLGESLPMGGSLSVRKPTHLKPLLIWGQDKCIYKQFLFRNKHYVGPNGEVPLMPKDEGQGLMISAFVSREYGFNWELSQSQLDQLNKTCENQIYVDEQAAISKKGTAKKEPIQSSPFKR